MPLIGILIAWAVPGIGWNWPVMFAPFEPTDADLYDGGGQQPAEVNKFLRYATPKDNRVKLPAGTTATWVIVYYGKTIQPSTFSATLKAVAPEDLLPMTSS